MSTLTTSTTLNLSATPNSVGIPKIIFQTWKNHDVPEHWKESQTAIATHFPDWKYVYHTDDDNRNFIATHYSWFLPIYDNYPFPIMRADAVRYFWLYHNGGMYIDMDIVVTSNFEHIFLENTAEVYFPFTQNIRSFTNCIMMSKQKAPFWLTMFKTLQTRNDWWIPIPHFAVIFKTGPMCLDGAVNNYDGTICLLPSNIISQNMTNPEIKNNKYTKAIKGKSWNRWDSHLIGNIFVYRRTLTTLALLLIFYFLFMFNYYKYNYYSCI